MAGRWLGDFLLAFDDVGDGRGLYGQLWGNRVYLPLVLRSLEGLVARDFPQ